MAFFDFLLVGLGGAIGSILRSLLSTVFIQHSPWPTLAVNLAGAFLIGILVKIMEGSTDPTSFRAFWVMGICGGFTTFSAFSLEMTDYIRDSQWGASISFPIR